MGWWPVGFGPVAFKEGLLREHRSKLLVIDLKEVVDDLAWLDTEPGGIILKVLPLLEQALIQFSGKVT